MKYPIPWRLLRSLLIFLSFVVALLYWDRFLPPLGAVDMTQPQLILHYFVQIGLWMSGASLLNRLIGIFFWDAIVAKGIGTTVPKLLREVGALLIYIIAITAIASYVFKQSLTGFWATSSAVSLILGFALREMILDLFSGMAINIESSFQIGDWIEVHYRSQPIIGQIIESNWRITRLKTDKNTTVIIPNSILSTTVVNNFWKPDKPTRSEANFTIDFSVPVERVRRVLLAGAMSVLKQEGFVSDREPMVLVDRTCELGIVYQVRYWTSPWDEKSPSPPNSRLMASILHHLKFAGITLAYPKEDIYHDQMPTRHLDTASVEDLKNCLPTSSCSNFLRREKWRYSAERCVTGSTRARRPYSLPAIRGIPCSSLSKACWEFAPFSRTVGKRGGSRRSLPATSLVRCPC